MRKLRLRTRDELLFIGLAIPSFLGILIFFLIPFGYSLYLAMIDNPVSRSFVWFENFVATFNNLAFRLAMRNTLVFMAMSVPINMIFPLFLALLLRKTPRRELFALFFLLPLVIPSGSVVHFWHSVFGINGALNGLFFRDAPVNWLTSDWALGIILVIFMWKNAGFNIVLYQAGLNQIPKEFYECAQVEGASKWQQFWRITFIYLMPTYFIVLLMSILATFRSFREIYLLTGAYPTPGIYMLQHFMNNMFLALDYQRLAPAAYMLAVGIIVVVVVVMFLQRRLFSYD